MHTPCYSSCASCRHSTSDMLFACANSLHRLGLAARPSASDHVTQSPTKNQCHSQHCLGSKSLLLCASTYTRSHHHHRCLPHQQAQWLTRPLASSTRHKFGPVLLGTRLVGHSGLPHNRTPRARGAAKHHTRQTTVANMMHRHTTAHNRPLVGTLSWRWRSWHCGPHSKDAAAPINI